MLVHHADAQCIGIVGVLDRDHLAVLADLALFRLIEAEENRHQRGLAGAVFAQQGMNLTLAQLQGNVVIGDDTWELFGDVQHFNCIRSFQVERPPSVFMARTRIFTGTETIY